MVSGTQDRPSACKAGISASRSFDSRRPDPRQGPHSPGGDADVPDEPRSHQMNKPDEAVSPVGTLQPRDPWSESPAEMVPTAPEWARTGQIMEIGGTPP